MLKTEEEYGTISPLQRNISVPYRGEAVVVVVVVRRLGVGCWVSARLFDPVGVRDKEDVRFDTPKEVFRENSSLLLFNSISLITIDFLDGGSSFVRRYRLCFTHLSHYQVHEKTCEVTTRFRCCETFWIFDKAWPRDFHF